MAMKCQRGPDLMLCITMSVLLVFVVCTTVYMALQTRQTVAQSTRIDELEGLVQRLNQRVVTLESLLASGKVLEGSGKEGESSGGKKSRLWNKVAAKEDQRRSRRQFDGYCPCITGPAGPPGIRGKRGHKGKSGKSGKDGKNGSKGEQGKLGVKGDQGPKGDPGLPGSQGPTGDPGLPGSQGPTGPIGARGYNGSRGEKGDKGGQGPPGPLIQESIHLVGNGDKQIQSHVSRSVTQWRVSGQSRGSIQYHKATGSIVIATSGYYFVYSQMFYCDVDKPVMGHVITINNKPRMKSFSSTIADHKRKYNTNYNGALMRLAAGDQVKLKVTTNDAMYYMDPRASYFGAFLLYPTEVV